MSVTQRRYDVLTDFLATFRFLEETFDHITLNSELLPHYFEYAQYHGMFDHFMAHRIGLWEDNGAIVAISAYEMKPGIAHLHTRHGYEYLLPELLDWAEQEISVIVNDKRKLCVMITDKETNKLNLLNSRGYVQKNRNPRTIFDYKKDFPELQLPDGFSIIDGTAADTAKLAECYWRGFNHEGPLPGENIDGNIKLRLSPGYNAGLATIVVAPNGEYACALGMYYDKRNKYAYLEPLATAPQYRRLGLATIALTEAMKKTKMMGATYCFGGWGEFYPSIGFETICYAELWEREDLDAEK